jgi:hypothetical protein
VKPQNLAIGYCDRTRKLAYATKAKAKRASVLIRSRSRDPRVSRVYLCPSCGTWHTTSKPLFGRAS